LVFDASENLARVDVVSIGPLFAELAPGGMQYSVVVIVPNRDGKDFAPSYVMLDIAQDPFMATVYRDGADQRVGRVFWSRADFWRRANACQILPKRAANRARKSGGGRDGSQPRAQLA
jgi:hypothetical protein